LGDLLSEVASVVVGWGREEVDGGAWYAMGVCIGCIP
jgi:hypothetical protein